MPSAIRPSSTVNQLDYIGSNTTLYASPTGNDTTGDGSASNPWATPQKALSWLANKYIADNATVTIQLSSGIFTLTSSITLSHPQSDRIRIVGQTPDEGYIWNLYEYTDSSGFTGNVSGITYETILRTNEGASATTESGTRFAMWVTPTGSTGESLGITFAVDDFIAIHPWNGSLVNLFYNSSVLDTNERGTSGITGPVGGRFSETENTLRRFYGLGVHRVIGLSGGSSADIVLDNFNTNRNQFQNLPVDGSGNGPLTGRSHNLSDPSEGYSSLTGGKKLRFNRPKTILYFNDDIDGIVIEKDSSINEIENVCVISRNRKTKAVFNNSSAFVVKDGGTLVLGDNVFVSFFGNGIDAQSGASVRSNWTDTENATIISNCSVGVFANNDSNINLQGCCTTGCDEGFLADRGSYIKTPDSVSVASTDNGFFSANGSSMIVDFSLSLYNGQRQAGSVYLPTNGINSGGSNFVALNSSSLESQGSLSHRSSGPGYYAGYSSFINANYSMTIDTLGGGVAALNSSSLKFENSVANQTGVFGSYAYNSSNVHINNSSFGSVGKDGPVAAGDSPISGPYLGDGVFVTSCSTVECDQVQVYEPMMNSLVANYNAVCTSNGANLQNPYSPHYGVTGGSSIFASYGANVNIDGPYTRGGTLDNDVNTVSAAYQGFVRWYNESTGLFNVLVGPNDGFETYNG